MCVTIQVSVCLSVRLSQYGSTPAKPLLAAAGLLLGPGGQETSIDCCTADMQQLQQPFNGRLSRTTRVVRYQKKHSPAHTHPGQRTSFITCLHLQRSTASSLFSLRCESGLTRPPHMYTFIRNECRNIQNEVERKM